VGTSPQSLQVASIPAGERGKAVELPHLMGMVWKSLAHYKVHVLF